MSRRRLPAALMRRRSAPSSWSPASLSGLSCWLRGDSGTFQDAGASVPAAAGDPVAAWLDRHGSGASASQVLSPKRPVRQDSGPQGTAALVFDGVDDFLYASLARDSAEVLYLVGRFETAANQTMCDAYPGNARRLYTDPGSGANPPSFYTSGGFLVASNPVSPGDWFACLVQCAGASSALRVAGVATAGTLGPSGDDLVLGTYGDPVYGVSMLDGALAEVVIVGGRILEAGEVDQLAAYTLSRYGLVL